MVQPIVNVRTYAIGPGGVAQQNLRLSPTASLSSGLAAALPSLTNVPTLAAPGRSPVARTLRPAVSPSIGNLHLLRGGAITPLDPNKSPQEQGISNGDVISLFYSEGPVISPTYDHLLKAVLTLLAKQGNLEVAQQKLETMANQERQFTQRNKVLWFILWMFAFLVAVSVALIMADGFRLWSFQLSTFVRNSIVTSILGEVATLVAIAFRFIFQLPTPPGGGGQSKAVSSKLKKKAA